MLWNLIAHTTGEGGLRRPVAVLKSVELTLEANIIINQLKQLFYIGNIPLYTCTVHHTGTHNVKSVLAWIYDVCVTVYICLFQYISVLTMPACVCVFCQGEWERQDLPQVDIQLQRPLYPCEGGGGPSTPLASTPMALQLGRC